MDSIPCRMGRRASLFPRQSCSALLVGGAEIGLSFLKGAVSTVQRVAGITHAIGSEIVITVLGRLRVGLSGMLLAPERFLSRRIDQLAGRFADVTANERTADHRCGNSHWPGDNSGSRESRCADRGGTDSGGDWMRTGFARQRIRIGIKALLRGVGVRVHASQIGASTHGEGG